MKGRFLVFLTVIFGLLLSALSAPQKLFFINETNSMERGLYFLTGTRDPSVNEIVLIKFPESLLEFSKKHPWLRSEVPLLKRVAALKGDSYCSDGKTLRINGVKVGELMEVDSAGKVLPRFLGCRELKADSFLALGDGEHSFDGRYFGELPKDLILGEAILLFRF